MATPETKAPEVSYLEMSDEELMNAKPPSSVGTSTTTTDEDDSADADESDEVVASDDADKVDSDDVADADGKGEDKAEDDEDPKADDDGGTPVQAKEADAGVKKEEPTKEVTPKVEEKLADEVKVDFEAEYKRLLAPFKANGRDIQVNTVDDAISLMQMGANYNKKMAALKPNLKLMKLLENNNLLSEEKIGFLIDLGKKDPAAINKLIKESGIDPMDLDAEKAGDYKQTTYTVDDREIELDTILDDIQGTPSYNQTLDIVSNKWDSASKQVIAANPQILKVINDHVQSGIYDQISKVVESERMFGRFNGMSDIEAYKQVGDALQAKGAFNHVGKGSSQPAGKTDAPPVVVTPKPKVVDDKLKDKKRAASSTKPASSSGKQEFDPLALSDEEFSKIVKKQF